MYANDCAGVFSAGPAIPGGSVLRTALADLDGDGTLDVLAAYSLPVRTEAWRYAGGAFTPLGAPVAGVAGEHITVADVDRDGDLDVLVSGTLSTNAFLLENAGNGSLLAIALPTAPGRVRAFDLDGAGPLELLVDRNAPIGQPVPRVFRRQGSGYVDVTTTLLPSGFNAVVTAVGDIDGDGDIDLAGSTVLRNDGSGVMATEPDLFVYPTRALTDIDGDGDEDLISADTVLWNRDRHVAPLAPPRIGRTAAIHLASQPGYAEPGSWGAVALAADDLARPLAGPFGLLWLRSPTIVAALPIPAPAGEATVTLPVPALASLVGTRVHLQAAFVRPSGLALSPAVSTRIE
jgi:hypothetical protein